MGVCIYIRWNSFQKRTADRPRQCSKCKQKFPVRSSERACRERIPADVNARSETLMWAALWANLRGPRAPSGRTVRSNPEQ